MIKIKGRQEKILDIIEQVGDFFRIYYPAKYQYFLSEMPKLRGISKSTYKDHNGNEVHVRIKVPTELFMSVQYLCSLASIEPKFGDSMDDIAMLTKRWREIDAAIPLQKDRPSLHIPPDVYRRIYGAKQKGQRRDVQADQEDATTQAKAEAGKAECGAG